MATDRKQDYYEALGVARDAAPRRSRRPFGAWRCSSTRTATGGRRRGPVQGDQRGLRGPLRPRAARHATTASATPALAAEASARGFEGFGLRRLRRHLRRLLRRRQRTHAGAAPGARRRPAATTQITFEEAVFGVENEFDVTRTELCTVCNGIRAEPGTEPERCPQCNGSGEVRRVQQSIFGQFVNVTMCDRCRGEGRIVATPCKHCRGRGRETEASARSQ